MRVSLLAYVITGLLAVGAGVAIAGLPSDPAETVALDPGAVTTASTTTTSATTDAAEEDDEPPAATDVAETDAAPDVDEVETTTTSSIPETTEPPATTTSSIPETTAPPATTTTTTAPPLVAPAELSVAVINATGGTVGLASDRADLLEEAGYTQVRTGDAFAQETSAVYTAPELEREAFWLINVADVPDAQILPIDEVPEITANGEFDLILVLGLDVLE